MPPRGGASAVIRTAVLALGISRAFYHHSTAILPPIAPFYHKSRHSTAILLPLRTILPPLPLRTASHYSSHHFTTASHYAAHHSTTILLPLRTASHRGPHNSTAILLPLHTASGCAPTVTSTYITITNHAFQIPPQLVQLLHHQLLHIHFDVNLMLV